MEIFRKLFSIAKIILAFNLANDQFFQNVGFLIDIKNHQLLNLIPDQKQYLNDEIELLKNSTKVLLLENSDIHNFLMMKNLCQGNIYNQLKSLLKKIPTKTNSDKLK